ncbi:uncharacterized protein METZ01_LOCUS395563, partial [marine metagenome]
MRGHDWKIASPSTHLGSGSVPGWGGLGFLTFPLP